jgi:hypothetical protein
VGALTFAHDFFGQDVNIHLEENVMEISTQDYLVTFGEHQNPFAKVRSYLGAIILPFGHCDFQINYTFANYFHLTFICCFY